MTEYERTHQWTADLHYAGPDNTGVHIIIDAAELRPDCFEVAALRTGGTELAMKTVRGIDEARRTYEALYSYYVTPRPEDDPKPLTGKYIKLRDDLRAVHKIGLDAAARVDDTGTCNFDAPALRLPRWSHAKIEQACKEAGGSCFYWDEFGRHVICLRIPGQALKREVAAEAMTEALSKMGYDAFCYQAID